MVTPKDHRVHSQGEKAIALKLPKKKRWGEPYSDLHFVRKQTDLFAPPAEAQVRVLCVYSEESLRGKD